MQKIKINEQNRYEILTPSGWSDFSGVSKQTSNKIVKIVTDNYKLRCTYNHKLQLIEGNFVFAQDIVVGNVILTDKGADFVIEITKEETDEHVYDALQVSKNNVYYTNGILSHNCQFLGSSGTLISGEKLKTLVAQKVIASSEGLKQYMMPVPGNSYALIADVSRGKGLDYSTFSIVDVTKMPYQQVCVFRDNFIGPADFASVIHRMGKIYNEAHTLIEINDIGGQVADILFLDFGYESILFTENGGRSSKRISGGFGKNVDRGIRTTKTVKSIGCSILKMLIEQSQLIINDFDTIQELARFSKKGTSYEAESGAHDDMVMTLVLFAWLSDQNFFKDVTDINTLMKLREKSEAQIEEELLPFGFVNTGSDETSVELMPGSDHWLANF